MRLMDFINSADWVPFMTMQTAGAAKHISLVRIIEALVIAGVTAAVSSYATVSVMKVEMGFMNARMGSLEQKFDKMQADLYVPRTHQ